MVVVAVVVAMAAVEEGEDQEARISSSSRAISERSKYDRRRVRSAGGESPPVPLAPAVAVAPPTAAEEG